MPRKQAIAPQVNFVGGLVTETTALRFPENACSETWNCVFDYTGRITRRPGIQLESASTNTVPAEESDDSYASYLWETVGIQGTQSFYVQQRGNIIYFYEAGNTTDYATNGIFQTVSLEDYVPDGSTLEPASYQCSFTEGRGKLIVANPACDPMLISYEQDSNILTVKTFTIKYRDFTGVEDGLGINERPSSSVADLKTDNPEHYYNLLNQGWHHQDHLDRWDTLFTHLPSNVDVPSYYTVINNSFQTVIVDEYVNTKISESLNTLAGKGHFILDAGSPSRNIAMANEGFTGATVVESSATSVPLTSLTTISGGTVVRPNAMFDGDPNQGPTIATAIGTSAYIGKSFSTSTNIVSVYVTTSTAGSGTTTLDVYGKTGSAPGSATDGTLLGTIDISSSGSASNQAGYGIVSSSPSFEWDHVWVHNSGSAAANIAEMYVLTGTPTYYRPSIAQSYAGRVFYAGLPNEGGNNSIYFTQILERDDQYGLCYQKNDPTSPDFFDLLSDDGGVIVIPDIGNVTFMFAYQSSLIVAATNGVWLISGSNRGPFQATDYSVRKISSISTVSKTSVVDRRGIPIWWAEDGIYTVQYSPQYDTFEVISISEKSIATFIREIPFRNRRFVKGTYDRDNDRIVWLYRDEDDSVHYDYTHALVMDGITNAFYPWSFSFDGNWTIKDIQFVRDIVGEATPLVKLYIQSTDTESMSFAEFGDVITWMDWETEDYDSWYITAYAIHGETQKDFQINYIFVFMEEEYNASLYMQGIHDFTSSSATGKWSTPQQCYKDGPSMKDIRFRRLKVRGTGKAIQLKMYSESGKPFTCIGWSTNESINADI